MKRTMEKLFKCAAAPFSIFHFMCPLVLPIVDISAHSSITVSVSLDFSQQH